MRTPIAHSICALTVTAMALGIVRESGATDDLEEVCRVETRTERRYYGTAVCVVYDPWAYQSVLLSGTTLYPGVLDSVAVLARQSDYFSYDDPYCLGYFCGGQLTCLAQLPLYYDTTVSDTVCELVPIEPHPDWLRYEYLSCSGYLRNGDLSWSAEDADSYEVETRWQNYGAWDRIYSGSFPGTRFDQVGGGSWRVRVRGIKDGAPGTWEYRTVNVPECGPSGPPPR